MSKRAVLALRRSLAHVGASNRTEVFFGRLSQYSILMGSFIACSPIERRHARQRVAEEPSSQVPRLEFGSAITIRQRQWTRPNARREY
jgi:hypothetical protein